MAKKQKSEYQILRKQAREKVDEKKGWYYHLVSFIGVSIILYIISQAVNVGPTAEFWILFPIIPLVFGLFIHYVVVFGFPVSSILSEEWEEEEIEKEMKRIIGERLKLSESDLDSDDRLILKEPVKSEHPSGRDFV